MIYQNNSKTEGERLLEVALGLCARPAPVPAGPTSLELCPLGGSRDGADFARRHCPPKGFNVYKIPAPGFTLLPQGGVGRRSLWGFAHPSRSRTPLAGPPQTQLPSPEIALPGPSAVWAL